jgi:hypothetical protein
VKVTVTRRDDGKHVVLAQGYNTDAASSARKVERKVQVLLPAKGICAKPGDVMLVLDVSGSFNQSELNDLKTAAKGIIARLSGVPITSSTSNIPTNSDINMGIAFLAAGAKLANPTTPMTSNARSLAQYLDSFNNAGTTFDFRTNPHGTLTGRQENPFIEQTGDYVRQGTNLAAGLLEGTRALDWANDNGRDTEPDTILLLTDGDPFRACWNNDAPAATYEGRDPGSLSCKGFYVPAASRHEYACGSPFRGDPNIPYSSSPNTECHPNHDYDETDGEKYAAEQEIVPYAEYIRSASGLDTNIYVLGINNEGAGEYDPELMKQIAGHTNSNQRYFEVANTGDLLASIEAQLTEACYVPPTSSTIITAAKSTGTIEEGQSATITLQRPTSDPNYNIAETQFKVKATFSGSGGLSSDYDFGAPTPFPGMSEGIDFTTAFGVGQQYYTFPVRALTDSVNPEADETVTLTFTPTTGYDISPTQLTVTITNKAPSGPACDVYNDPSCPGFCDVNPMHASCGGGGEHCEGIGKGTAVGGDGCDCPPGSPDPFCMTEL